MAKEHIKYLLKQKRFLPFFVTQALGAFNDNVFKNALIILIAFQGASLSTQDSNVLINLAAGLFILPFFLFSASAGQFADKYEKSMLIRRIKLLEIGIMLLATIGFYLQNIWLLMSVLFLMGFQSALFGPIKYGILPQVLKNEELIGGNGLISMGTFLAILLGTMLGGVLIGIETTGLLLVSIAVICVAVIGYIVSRAIPKTTITAPSLKINWNPFSEMYRNFGYIRKHRVVLLAILGISWFWFFGATFLAQIPNYTKTVLNGDESVVTLLLTLFSIGIGAGSLLCDRLSGNRVEIGLVPLGSIGLTVFGIDLFFAHPTASNELVNAGVFLTNVSNWRIIIDLVLIGLFGGFYIVPLNAMVQQRTEASHRARVIASNNILNACFMVVSAVFAIVAFKLGASIPQLLLITALLNAGVAIYIYTLVPEFLMRFLIWLLIHTMYKVKSNNLEHIPEKGPVLLVCNHVSYVDALIIGGCIRRPVRFVMYHRIYNLPILKFVFKTAKAIPIAPAKENEELLESAYQQIDEALNNGEVVCIFPEGKITTDGKLNEFKSGVEKIVERTPVPVIPMGLSGLWGSFFSYRDGKAMQKWPKRFWAKVKLTVAPAITDKEITANNVQQKVHKLLKKLEQ